MGMKMDFDYTQSRRQIAPAGEYGLRAKKMEQKISKSSQKPMLEFEWTPFDPPSGVTMDQIVRCTIRDWVSLAPNALFSLKDLLFAGKILLECKNCNNEYEGRDPDTKKRIEVCPQCGSAQFAADLSLLQNVEIRGDVIEKKLDDGADANEIKNYIRP